MSDITVLVVDDQRLVREGITSLLKLQEGLSVVATAEDGRTGVLKALEHQPDIILMDIRMPLMDGIQALETLNSNSFSGKVIMLTTFDDEEYIVKSLKAGAAGYLMKDIPVDDLGRAVKQAHSGLFQFAPTVMGALIQNVKTQSSPVDDLLGTDSLNLIDRLSEREKEIFIELGRGLTNKEIALELHLSEGTIKNYVSAIFTALGLRDRVQAALLAMKWELFSKNTYKSE